MAAALSAGPSRARAAAAGAPPSQLIQPLAAGNSNQTSNRQKAWSAEAAQQKQPWPSRWSYPSPSSGRGRGVDSHVLQPAMA
eukprot:CAMPEP_0175468014 /NCGR_PEP_ID=MMETSP0095-20121207/71608_1 /TAXON_ID=311494 /ORGANISM="Alexandrium monilatum, Strain CCMP3105" /LENGTH=81 /DNA_ID=CAMNT_0016769387 /DNA_START=36 /DNA_END=278 /DNA_ORIENTATION=-